MYQKRFMKTKAEMKMMKDPKSYLSQYVAEWLEKSDTTEEEMLEMIDDFFTEGNNIAASMVLAHWVVRKIDEVDGLKKQLETKA